MCGAQDVITTKNRSVCFGEFNSLTLEKEPMLGHVTCPSMCGTTVSSVSLWH